MSTIDEKLDALSTQMTFMLQMMEEANAGICRTLRTSAVASRSPVSSSSVVPPMSSTPTTAPTPAALSSTSITTPPGGIHNCMVPFSTCSEHAVMWQPNLGVPLLSSSTSSAFIAPTAAAPTEPTAALTSWLTPTDLSAPSTTIPTPNSPGAEEDFDAALSTRCSTDCFSGDSNMLVSGSRLGTILTVMPTSSPKEAAVLGTGLFVHAHRRFEVMSFSPCAFSVNDGKCYGSMMSWSPPVNHERSYSASCVFDRGKSNLTILDTPQWTLQQAGASASWLGIHSLALVIELKPWPNWYDHQDSLILSQLYPPSRTEVWFWLLTRFLVCYSVHKYPVWYQYYEFSGACHIHWLQLLTCAWPANLITMELAVLIQYQLHIVISDTDVYYLLITCYHQPVHWKFSWLSRVYIICSIFHIDYSLKIRSPPLKNINSLLIDTCRLCSQSWQHVSSGQLDVLLQQPWPSLCEFVFVVDLQNSSAWVLAISFTIVQTLSVWQEVSGRADSITVLPTLCSHILKTVISYRHSYMLLFCFSQRAFMLLHYSQWCLGQLWKPPGSCQDHVQVNRSNSLVQVFSLPLPVHMISIVIMKLLLVSIQRWQLKHISELASILMQPYYSWLSLNESRSVGGNLVMLQFSTAACLILSLVNSRSNKNGSFFYQCLLFVLASELLLPCCMAYSSAENLIYAMLILHWAEYTNNPIFLFGSLHICLVTSYWSNKSIFQITLCMEHDLFCSSLGLCHIQISDQQEAGVKDYSCTRSATFHHIVIKHVEDTSASSKMITHIILLSEVPILKSMTSAIRKFTVEICNPNGVILQCSLTWGLLHIGTTSIRQLLSIVGHLLYSRRPVLLRLATSILFDCCDNEELENAKIILSCPQKTISTGQQLHLMSFELTDFHANEQTNLIFLEQGKLYIVSGALLNLFSQQFMFQHVQVKTREFMEVPYKTIAGCIILELEFYHMMIEDP